MLELVWSWCSMCKKKKKTEAEQECQAGRKSGIIWRNSERTRDYRRVLIGWVNFLHRLERNTKPKGQVLHQTVWGVCNNFLKLFTMLIKEKSCFIRWTAERVIKWLIYWNYTKSFQLLLVLWILFERLASCQRFSESLYFQSVSVHQNNHIIRKKLLMLPMHGWMLLIYGLSSSTASSGVADNIPFRHLWMPSHWCTPLIDHNSGRSTLTASDVCVCLSHRTREKQASAKSIRSHQVLTLTFSMEMRKCHLN